MMPYERLKLARERAGYETATSAATAMGCAVATYVHHENGTRGIPSARAARYAKFFRVTPEYLLFGKGDEPTQNALPLRESNVPLRSIPILGSVQAGMFSVLPDFQEPLGEIPVSLPNFNGVGLYALYVKGPSMDLCYPDGTMIIVCPVQDIGVREGDHVIVRRTTGAMVETTVKEVIQEQAGIALWPRSSDPQFQEPIRIKPDRDADQGAEIIGVVVASYAVRPSQNRPLIQI